MPRYFFDIYDGTLFIRDTVGTVCDGLAGVRYQAMCALPAIASDKIPAYGDCQAFTVLVRDEEDIVVYTATLNFAGLWVGDIQIPLQEIDLPD